MAELKQMALADAKYLLSLGISELAAFSVGVEDSSRLPSANG